MGRALNSEQEPRRGRGGVVGSQQVSQHFQSVHGALRTLQSPEGGDPVNTMSLGQTTRTEVL